MFQYYKIIFIWSLKYHIMYHIGRIIGKFGAETHQTAENAPVTHISNNPTIGINSQHPYLLGFDSNLVPNFNILVFQPYPGEDSEYSEESRRFACISASPPGNTPNTWENH